MDGQVRCADPCHQIALDVMTLGAMSSDPAGTGTAGRWPAIGSVELPWRSSIPPDLVPRSVRARHAGPYRAAAVPLVADRTPPVGSQALALAEEAAHEVGRFDAEVGREVAPFAAVLLRSESASSSQIEHITAGARALAVAVLGGPERGRRRNAALVAGNVAAMQAALDLAGRLDPDAVLAMHGALLRDSEPDIAGRLRTEQVWIGGSSYGPHAAEFVPPPADAVAGLLADLLDFAGRTDVPTLVQAAVAHAQFETVHPFVDGNGRVGRALVHTLLRRRGLTRAVTVPVSAGLLADVPGYFAGLTAYRSGDPSPIVAALASGALTAVGNARRLVADLHEVRDRWRVVVRARRDSAAWRVAELLLRQPVVDAGTVAAATGVAPANAVRALTPLLEAGVLTELTGAARNRMRQAGEVLAALDAFAARATRRTGRR